MKNKKLFKVACAGKGAGCIPEPFPTTTNVTRICPACSGSGVIIITEVIETDELSSLEKEVPEKNRKVICMSCEKEVNYLEGIFTCSDCSK